jgi:hypothetical protein
VVCIVEHDKERLQAGQTFASGPLPGHPAGRGHRRGLDGPSMPKASIKSDESFPREC